MNPENIIEKYYDKGTRLYETLMTHSMRVRDKAFDCIRHRALQVDEDFVSEASMLHDIGVFKCYAPDIYCIGDMPYICHGVEGRKILEAEGYPMHGLVCERHTGAGLTIEDIRSQDLPLPLRDMTPQTIEEKLICYADKFFSKSGDINREKGIEEVLKSMERHGEDTLGRFKELHMLFG